MPKKRWTGEFLVEVREDGSVLLPILDFDAAQPTHYRISSHHTPGSMVLHPMKVATAEDLKPPEPDPPKAPAAPIEQRPYTDEERESLDFECPFCGAEKQAGCRSKPSLKLLIDYPSTDGRNLVHTKRLELARDRRQLQRSSEN